MGSNERTRAALTRGFTWNPSGAADTRGAREEKNGDRRGAHERLRRPVPLTNVLLAYFAQGEQAGFGAQAGFAQLLG